MNTKPLRINPNLRHFAGILLLLVVTFPAAGQISYQQALDRFLAEPALAAASVGVCVLDAQSGKELLSHDADLARIPASTMKVVTTRYAIEMLTLDFRFKTHFGYTGSVDSTGVLQGDLVVQGGGDPTLGSSHFPNQTCLEPWLNALRGAGIHTVKGKLIVLDNVFEGPPLAGSTAIEDGGNYYGVGAFGLNYRDNTFEVNLRSGSDQTRVEVLEAQQYPVEITSYVKASTRSADLAFGYSMPHVNNILIYGSIPQNQSAFKIKLAMPNPAIFLADDLRVFFKEHGILIHGENEVITDNFKTDFKVIHTIESPTLQSILNKTNEKSINLYAAALFKMIGKVNDDEGSFEGAWRAISKTRLVQGKKNTGLFIADGSGLSRLNTLTARQLAECVLPMAGDLDLALTGGWKSFGGSPAVRVKSGYIGGVRSYAGRIERTNGAILCFSVVVNHGAGSASEVRLAIERWVALMR